MYQLGKSAETGSPRMAGKMSEVWKKIPNHPMYEVSSEGRVRSLERTVMAKNSWGQMRPRKYKSKILRPRKHTQGYLRVTLTNQKDEFVHRMVAIAFLNKTAEFVNHKNGIKSDNRVDNLEWVTQSENNIHAFNLGLTVENRKKASVRMRIYNEKRYGKTV